MKKARNKLQVWQDRLSRARAEYQDTLNKMIEWNAYYDGTRISQNDPNGGRKATRKSSNVRNIVYELTATSSRWRAKASRARPRTSITTHGRALTDGHKGGAVWHSFQYLRHPPAASS